MKKIVYVFIFVIMTFIGVVIYLIEKDAVINALMSAKSHDEILSMTSGRPALEINALELEQANSDEPKIKLDVRCRDKTFFVNIFRVEQSSGVVVPVQLPQTIFTVPESENDTTTIVIPNHYLYLSQTPEIILVIVSSKALIMSDIGQVRLFSKDLVNGYINKIVGPANTYDWDFIQINMPRER